MRKIIVLIFLFCGIFYKTQYNEDLYKKASAEIYENPDQSLLSAEKMLKKESNVDYIIKLYQLMSRAYTAKRDFDKSLDCVMKLKDLSKTLTDPSQKIKIYNTIAIQYQHMGINNKSIEALDEAYALCNNLPDSPQKMYYLGMNFTIRGLIYKTQNNNELALEKLLPALDYFRKAKDQENSVANTSIVLYNIGYCYFYSNKISQAEHFFKESATVAQSINAESLEAFAYKGLSETFMLQGKHQQAIDLLKQAEVISKKVGDLVLTEGIYKGLSDNYLALQDWGNYENYNKKYSATKFEREQSELASINKTIDVLNQENNHKLDDTKQQFLISSLIIAGVFLVLMGIFIPKLIRYKKQNKQLLEKINQISKAIS